MELTAKQKAFFEQLMALADKGLTLNEAVIQVAFENPDLKSVPDLKRAVEQIEKDLKAQAADLTKQLAAIKSQAWDRSGNYRGVFASEAQAAAFGCVCLGMVKNDPEMRQWARDEYKRSFASFNIRAMAEGTDTAGGSLVPIEFSTRIKRLIERYGVFAATAYHMPMASEQLEFNRQTGEVTVWITGENKAPTDSQVKTQLVTLTAKEWNALVYYPRVLAADMLAPIGELVARSIAWAYAYKLDQVGFNSDGTSNYSTSLKGLCPQLLGVYTGAGNASAGGVVKGSGAGWAGLTLSDFAAVLGTLPEYADQRAAGRAHARGPLALQPEFLLHRHVQGPPEPGRGADRGSAEPRTAPGAGRGAGAHRPGHAAGHGQRPGVRALRRHRPGSHHRRPAAAHDRAEPPLQICRAAGDRVGPAAAGGVHRLDQRPG
jgi:HK97 family phage major capsid protein